MFHTPFDLARYLNFSRDETTGQIVKGIATSMTWLGQIDVALLDQPDSISGTGMPVGSVTPILNEFGVLT